MILYISKAFDTFNHTLLLEILSSDGFGVNTRLLIEPYLPNRTQVLRIDRSISNHSKSKNDVPQGSILGPLLNIIYASRFLKFVDHYKIYKYADDIQLYLLFIFNNDLMNIAPMFLKTNHFCKTRIKQLFGNEIKCHEIKRIMSIRISRTLIYAS